VNFEIDHKSPVPLHVQVENLLRELIRDPDYRDGKLLPKEVDMAKRLGISRNTVRQATNKLANEKLLIRKKGFGTKVSSSGMTSKLDNWYSFSDEMTEHGITLVNYQITAEWKSADDETSRALEIEKGDKVMCLERLRGTEHGPTVYFISFFHPRVGLTGQEDFSRHLYQLLDQDYSTVVDVSKEEIQAKIADDSIARLLQIEVGSPVLFRRRKVYDPGGRPIEFNLGYYRAEEFTYSIEIGR